MDIGIPDSMGNECEKALDYSYVKREDDNHWW